MFHAIEVVVQSIEAVLYPAQTASKDDICN